MADINQAYVVIGGSNPISAGDIGGSVEFTYVVLTPDNTHAVGGAGVQSGAQFNYGDSNEKIRENIVNTVRVSFGDSELDVNFVTG